MGKWLISLTGFVNIFSTHMPGVMERHILKFINLSDKHKESFFLHGRSAVRNPPNMPHGTSVKTL